MASLFPRVAISVGETLTSFVSRLAKVNLLELPAFCRLVGIRVSDVADATDDVLEVLHGMVDLSPATLRSNAIVRDELGLSVRGQRMGKTDVRRERLLFCPECLAEDVAKGGESEAYGRLAWSLSAILTCPIHALSLCEAGPAETLMRHDFAGRVAPLLPHLDAARELTTKRNASSFEGYLMRRLDGGQGEAPWLDGLAWHAATKVCEIVGAMETIGRSPNLRALDSDERHSAFASGFDILRGGETALRDFMRRLNKQFVHGHACKEGPQAVLGRLWHFLAFSSPDTDFDPVRDVVRDFVVEHFPIGAGTTVLGRDVTRKVHSVCSASRETGVDSRRLRKMLIAGGHLAPADDAPDALATFEGRLADEFLAALARSIPTAGVAEYLKASKSQVVSIVQAGLIEPFARPDEGLRLRQTLYAKSDLDAFLSTLTVDIREDVPPFVERPRLISGAVKAACCTTAVVVGLIVRRKLKWVGRAHGAEGFRSIMVDAAEVCRLTDRIQGILVTSQMAMQLLDLSRKDLYCLIRKLSLPHLLFDSSSSSINSSLLLRPSIEEIKRNYKYITASERKYAPNTLRPVSIKNYFNKIS